MIISLFKQNISNVRLSNRNYSQLELNGSTFFFYFFPFKQRKCQLFYRDFGLTSMKKISQIMSIIAYVRSNQEYFPSKILNYLLETKATKWKYRYLINNSAIPYSRLYIISVDFLPSKQLYFIRILIVS